MRVRTSCLSSPSRARRPPICASGSPPAFSAATRRFPVTTFHAFCFAVLMRDAAVAPRLARPAERRAVMQAALAAEQNLGLPLTRALLEEAMRFAELCDDYLRVPDHDLARVRERYVDRPRSARRARLRRAPARSCRAARAERGDASDVPEHASASSSSTSTRIRTSRRSGSWSCSPASAATSSASRTRTSRSTASAAPRSIMRSASRSAGRARAATTCPSTTARRRGIVDLATSVIRRNVDTHLGKELRAAHDQPAEIVGRTFRHAAEEADWIAREIAALRQEGVALGQIAVLARSLKEIGPRLAYTLRTHGIPFHAPLAPELHPSADALLSLLELAAAYPWEPAHDDAALRVLASPLFGANPLELRRFQRRDAHALRRVARGGRVRGVLPGVGDRQAPANRGRLDLRPLGEARALPRARVCGRDARGDRGARSCNRPLRRSKRVRRRAVRLPAGVSRGRARSRRVAALGACRLGRRGAPHRAPGEGPRVGRSLRLRAHRGQVPGARALAVRAVRSRDLRGLAHRRGGPRPAGARGGAPALLRRDDARAQPAHADRDGGAARGIRSIPVAVLPGSRSPSSKRAASARSPSRRPKRLPPCGAPAAAREVGATTSRRQTRMRCSRPEGCGRPRRAWRPYENCPLQFFYGSLVEIGRRQHDLDAARRCVPRRARSLPRPRARTSHRRSSGCSSSAEEQSFEEVKPRPLAAEQRRLLERLLENYFASEIAPGLDAEVLAVEQGFRFELDASTLRGFIDRIDRLPDGNLRLIDYKTSKRAMKADEAEAGPPARPLRACLSRRSGTTRARRGLRARLHVSAPPRPRARRPAWANGDARPSRSDAAANPGSRRRDRRRGVRVLARPRTARGATSRRSARAIT